MKYLYKLVRLFFCPHKYKSKDRGQIVNEDKVIIGTFYNKECRYCGKMRVFNLIS